MIHEFCIRPCPSGFGEYQCGEPMDSQFDCEEDLVKFLEDEGFAELGSQRFLDLENDDLDISGQIYNQPDRVFVRVDDENPPEYYGFSIESPSVV